MVVLGPGTVDNVEIVANIVVELQISVQLGIVTILLGIIGTVTSVWNNDAAFVFVILCPIHVFLRCSEIIAGWIAYDIMYVVSAS